MDTSRNNRRATQRQYASRQINGQQQRVERRPFAFNAPAEAPQSNVSARPEPQSQRMVQPQQSPQPVATGPRIGGDTLNRLRAPALGSQAPVPAAPVAPQFVAPAPAPRPQPQPQPQPIMAAPQVAVQKQPVVTQLRPVYEAPQLSSAQPAPARPAPVAPVLQEIQQPVQQPIPRSAFRAAAQAEPQPVAPPQLPVQQLEAPSFAPPQEPLQPRSFEPAEEFVAAAQRRPSLPKLDLTSKIAALKNFDKDEFIAKLRSKLSWQHVRQYGFRGAAAAIVVVIALGGVIFSQGFLKSNKVFQGTAATATALKKQVDPNMLKGEGSGRVNVLLLGRAGDNRDGADLTDTMMIVSVDPVNKTSTLLSIPRDLWVQVPGGGPMKINAAWETGVFKYTGKTASVGTTDPKAIQAGFSTVDGVIKEALGVDIHYNVIVDLDALKQSVDTVGGVAIDVPADLVDPSMARENNNDPVLARAGTQTLNGEKAFNYVRSAATTGDADRAQRQRAVMLALKTKVQTLGTVSNPLKISGLINAFGDNISTDMSADNAARFYKMIDKISDANTSSVGLNDDNLNKYITPTTIKNQPVIVPTEGQFAYGALQDYVHSKIKDPYLVREKAKVIVLNGTLLPGIASKEGEKLKSYGYNVIAQANTPNSGWTQTMLYDLSGGKHKYTKNYLEQRYGTAKTKLNDQTIATNGADFVIIIGSNAIDNPKN